MSIFYLQGAFNLEYLPLKVGEGQGRLEFNCNDLGLYMYDLNMKATSAGPERALYFRTCIGSSHSSVAKFLNFAKQKTDYTCKVRNLKYVGGKQLIEWYASPDRTSEDPSKLSSTICD